jgi:lipoprotein NlpD
VTTARVETRSLETKPGSAIVPQSGASAPTGSASGAAAAPPAREAAAPAAPREGDDDINWAWPATAPVSTPFDDARNKGLVFRGKPGDPVYAAADGRVVYAGSGLRGYGNLVILKHNATYLTAYAHNQTLLVKDDQQVKRGQKIAEMGSTDADGVQLHFEIRKQGKPIDPARLLPAR